jgi:hypothetical protein
MQERLTDRGRQLALCSSLRPQLELWLGLVWFGLAWLGLAWHDFSLGLHGRTALKEVNCRLTLIGVRGCLTPKKTAVQLQLH